MNHQLPFTFQSIQLEKFKIGENGRINMGVVVVQDVAEESNITGFYTIPNKDRMTIVRNQKEHL